MINKATEKLETKYDDMLERTAFYNRMTGYHMQLNMFLAFNETYNSENMQYTITVVKP